MKMSRPISWTYLRRDNCIFVATSLETVEKTVNIYLQQKLQHGFIAANDKLIQVHMADISFKMW